MSSRYIVSTWIVLVITSSRKSTISFGSSSCAICHASGRKFNWLEGSSCMVRRIHKKRQDPGRGSCLKKEKREATQFRSVLYPVRFGSIQFRVRVSSIDCGVVSLRQLLPQILCRPTENFKYNCISVSWIVLTRAVVRQRDIFHTVDCRKLSPRL